MGRNPSSVASENRGVAVLEDDVMGVNEVELLQPEIDRKSREFSSILHTKGTTFPLGTTVFSRTGFQFPVTTTTTEYQTHELLHLHKRIER
ncbi:unnamed protein product [Allacma fusca]|uniref:Uncharacterized protein n=1 Tax=Allacma fusca TaxID=39272 RepID=A0A8J2L3W9_9HEXA|nr:unnamed protein product [Allacma fusca]